MKIDSSKICIRSIGYSEQPVLSITEGMCGSLQNRVEASVEVYTGNSWEDFLVFRININDFPGWDDLRSFICDRVREELDSIK